MTYPISLQNLIAPFVGQPREGSCSITTQCERWRFIIYSWTKTTVYSPDHLYEASHKGRCKRSEKTHSTVREHDICAFQEDAVTLLLRYILIDINVLNRPYPLRIARNKWVYVQMIWRKQDNLSIELTWPSWWKWVNEEGGVMYKFGPIKGRPLIFTCEISDRY